MCQISQRPPNAATKAVVTGYKVESNSNAINLRLGDDFGQPLLKHFHLLALTHTYNSFLGLLLLLLLVFLLSLLTLTSGFCNKLFTYSNIWLL